MPTPISYLIDDAALAIGDPNKGRVSPTHWLSFYNRATRELCQKANVLKYEGEFNLEARAEYRYPAEMTCFKGVEVTLTADDDDSWFFLKEMFEDEFREYTDRTYPIDALPSHYFAEANGFFLIPRPQATLSNCGLMHYFGLPDRVSDPTVNMQTDDTTQDLITRRIFGMRARNRLVEAAAEYATWKDDVESLMDKLDDRSQDRRSSLAPRRRRYSGMN